MNKDTRVIVYSDYPSPSLNIDLVIENLKSYGFSVENRGNFVEFLSLSKKSLYDLAQDFSSTYINDIESPLDIPSQFNSSDIQIEVDKLSGLLSVRGKFYDGYWIQRFFYKLFAESITQEIKTGFVHLIFTDRLFGTFEDRRYHARVLLVGMPSLISTSGIVEAPAKPKEYYYIKGRLIQSGFGTQELDKMYKGRYVEYDDPKITSILTSYALQVIFYEITGQAFCDTPECCLSNSHWQEEVLNVHYEGRLCDKCNNILIEYKKRGRD